MRMKLLIILSIQMGLKSKKAQLTALFFEKGEGNKKNYLSPQYILTIGSAGL